MPRKGSFGVDRRLGYVMERALEQQVAAEVLDPSEDLFRRHFPGLVRFAALLGADDPAT